MPKTQTKKQPPTPAKAMDKMVKTAAKGRAGMKKPKGY